MKELKEWMELYGVSHKNPINIMIHKACVPLIMFSLMGMIWKIPFVYKNDYFINWASLFFLFSLLFYIRLSFKVFILMALQGSLMLYGVYLLSQTPYLLSYSIIIFILAWIGQFIGHKIEGKKPSFFEDLQFLLIGPIWIYPFFK